METDGLQENQKYVLLKIAVVHALLHVRADTIHRNNQLSFAVGAGGVHRGLPFVVFRLETKIS